MKKTKYPTNKKLLIVIWNMGLGGIQKRVRDIVIDIDKNYPDWETHLLIKFKQPSHFLDKLINLKNTKIIYYSESHKKSKSLPSFLWIIKNYLIIKPNVLLTFLDHLSITAILIKKIIFWQKTKIVLNEGVLTSKYLDINRHPLWKIPVKIFYKFADLIIVPTKAIKNDLSKNFMVKKATIKVVPNWTLFKKSKTEEKQYDLIFVGRFDEEKNPIGFVNVVQQIRKKIPNLKAIMLGDGKQKKQIQELIKNHQLSKNLKIIPPSDPRKFFSKSRIFVLPTLNEGMPNVVLEAAIFELPSVTSNFIGANEVIINGKTGFITKSNKDMSKTLISMLKNPNKIITMGRKAKLNIENNFSYKNQTIFIKTLLKSLDS